MEYIDKNKLIKHLDETAAWEFAPLAHVRYIDSLLALIHQGVFNADPSEES